MSESDLSGIDDDFNHESCIITHNDDDDVSSSSDNEDLQPSNEASQDCESNIFDLNMTCSQVMEAKLNAEDTIVFVLGMLNTIEKYLNNLKKDVHRYWLETNIKLTKTALISNLQFLQDNKARSITAENAKKKAVTKTDKVNNLNKGTVAVQTQKQSVKKEKNANRVKPEPVLSKNLTSTPLQTRKSNRNQISKNNRKDYELVYCDKFTYSALNLSAIAIPFPDKNKKNTNPSRASRGNKNSKSNTNKPTNKRSKSMGQLSKQSDAEQSVKTVASVKKSVQEKKSNKSPHKDNTKSAVLHSTGSNKNTNEKSRPNKRRAVSLGAVNSKKAKKCEGTPGDITATEKSKTGKRKLYSPSRWTESLPAILLNPEEQF